MKKAIPPAGGWPKGSVFSIDRNRQRMVAFFLKKFFSQRSMAREGGPALAMEPMNLCVCIERKAEENLIT